MVTQALWFELLTFLFFWGGVAAFLVGLITLIAPSLVLRAGGVLNRWISTEQVFRDLDAPRPTERFFYRHHRIFGILLMLGAIFVAYSFGFALDISRLEGKFMLFGSRNIADWLLESLVMLNLVFAALALLLGLTVFFRPSVLKDIEARTNRWFVMDDSLKRLDVELRVPDQLFARHPRILGLLIMAGSAYVIFSLGVFVRF